MQSHLLVVDSSSQVREVLTKERKTPLLLAGSEELHAEVLAFFSQEIGQDKKKQPIPRGYIMDTRPMVLGQTRTGVKFEDAVKACKKCLSSSVRNATCVVPAMPRCCSFLLSTWASHPLSVCPNSVADLWDTHRAVCITFVSRFTQIISVHCSVLVRILR